MKTSTRNALILVTAVGVGAAALAVAAPRGPGAWGDCPHAGVGRHAGMPGAGPMGMAADPGAAAARFEALKQRLAITPEQEGAWQAFVDGHLARQAARREGTGFAPGASAGERIQARIERMETMLDGMKQHAASLDRLYQALSPEQRATADRLLGPGRRAF